MSLLKPGTYPAKLVNYNFGEGDDASKPVITLEFQVQIPGGGVENIRDYTYLHTPGALGVTFKKLALLGFSKEGELEDLCDGTGSGALNQEQDYQLVLEQDQYQAEKGNPDRVKVQYINLPGGGPGAAKPMDKAKAKERLAAMGVDFKTAYAEVHDDPKTVKPPEKGVDF